MNRENTKESCEEQKRSRNRVKNKKEAFTLETGDLVKGRKISEVEIIIFSLDKLRVST